MEHLLNQLQYWHWLSFGIVLMVFEVLGAGGILLWCGIAALVVGVLLWLVPIPWEGQLFLFAVLSIISVVLWRLYWKKNPPKVDQPNLNQRTQRLLDRELVLPATLIPGESVRIKIDGTHWKASSEVKISAGEKVKVVAVSGNEIHIQPVD